MTGSALLFSLAHPVRARRFVRAARAPWPPLEEISPEGLTLQSQACMVTHMETTYEITKTMIFSAVRINTDLESIPAEYREAALAELHEGEGIQVLTDAQARRHGFRYGVIFTVTEEVPA